MLLWVWRNFGIEVPEDWEMLQFSKKADAGNVAFADRYRFRLELSWRVLRAAPDLERMMSDYCAKLKLEDPEGVASRVKAAGWPGILSGSAYDLADRRRSRVAGRAGSAADRARRSPAIPASELAGWLAGAVGPGRFLTWGEWL